MFPGLAVLVSGAAAACHSDSDSAAPTPVPFVINRGLAAEHLRGTGAFQLVGASESGQGRDLTGDGDTRDVVLHVLDFAAGTLTNTGLAFPPSFHPEAFAANEDLGAFLVSELETGRDADQDGSPDEVSTWTFTARTGALASQPFAHAQVELHGELAALVVPDDGGGTGALHVLDARGPRLTTLRPEPSRLPRVGDEIVAFMLAEKGALDLNADGDTTDSFVLQVFDPLTQQAFNTTLDARAGHTWIASGSVGFGISEPEHGLDLNGDGDGEDVVFAAADAQAGSMRILSLSLVGTFPILISDSFVLPASEEHGDKNGDGDRLDRIAVVYDPRTDRLLDTGLALASSQPFADGQWFALPVDERAQGFRDGNGDRELSIDLRVFDAATGTSESLGFTGQFRGAAAGHFLIERDEHLGDLNGDGDQTDFVLFTWDNRARTASNTGLAFGNPHAFSGERALVSVSEAGQGVDLNGDGDELDHVLHVFEGSSERVLNLGLAVPVSASLGAGARSAVLVDEAEQGADLNGDGDRSDRVLHEIVLGPPR